MFFNSFQYLESFKICCSVELFNESEKNLLDVIANYSPGNFCRLVLEYSNFARSELLPEELESFFISWKNRIPQKSLSLIIIDNYNVALDKNDENKKIIEKYVELSVIKMINKWW